MLDQRDFSGKAALHHAVADTEERHQVVQTLLAAKSQVFIFIWTYHGIVSTEVFRPEILPEAPFRWITIRHFPCSGR